LFQQTEFGNSPPDTGEIHMRFPIAPVSLQASRAKKDIVTNAIRAVTKTVPFVLTGDVQINIEWRVHEQVRYEADKSPDMDNIIKPIFDALCGSEGLLIDDCQVQAVDCRWIDWTRHDEEILIYIRFFEEYEWRCKKWLVFVHFGKGLCLPIYKNKTPDFRGSDLDWSKLLLEMLDLLEQMLRRRDEFLKNVADDYYVAKGMMPSQRIFHRSRVSEFTVLELDELRQQLEATI